MERIKSFTTGEGKIVSQFKTKSGKINQRIFIPGIGWRTINNKIF